MSNNSHPALISNNSDGLPGTSTSKGAWGEIGVAQAVQAEACRLVRRVEMNPLLLGSVLNVIRVAVDLRRRSLWIDRLLV
jgi:cobyric acid synthase